MRKFSLTSCGHTVMTCGHIYTIARDASGEKVALRDDGKIVPYGELFTAIKTFVNQGREKIFARA